MVLEKTCKVKSVLKNTKAKMFSDTTVGDMIRLSLEIDTNSVHISDTDQRILCYNFRTGGFVRKTIKELYHILKCFEFEE